MIISDLDELIDTSGITTLEMEPETDSIESIGPTEFVPHDTPSPSGMYRRDISRFLFVDIETVPDWDRLDLFDLDIPNKPRTRTPVDQCPDVATIAEKKIDDIKAELRLAWPCPEWLGMFLDAEQKREKGPRAGVKDAVRSIMSEMDADLNAESAFIKKLSVNPQYCKIAALGFACGECDPKGMIGDEREMLEKFWSMAAMSNPIVGFNSNHFDLRAILTRSLILGIKPTRKLDVKPWSDSCLDLMVVLFGANGEQGMGLKKVARMYGINIKEEGCDGSHVYRLMQEDPEKVRRYVASDASLNRDLFRKIEGYFV